MNKHYLLWNESRHSVGIALIDSQHQELIGRVNEIANGITKNDQSEALQEMLSGLLLFVSEHFAFEERLMAEYDFPEVESHIEEHHRLLQQLSNIIKANPREPRQNNTALVSAFLTDWTEQHILEADKELGKFLTAKGLS
jgi:hemerythrin